MSEPGVLSASRVDRRPGLRGNANWRRLWLGQAVSLTGDSVFDITVMLWVVTVLAKGRPWAPAAAGGVMIVEAVPVLLIAPVAGVFVDRWDRRRTMLAADAFRAVLIAALLALPLLGRGLGAVGEVTIVYAVVAAQSAAAQFFNPSRLATMGRIVAPADRPKASGQLQATMSMATIIGEPLGAFLLTGLGVQAALIINAASFAVSFLTIRAIRLPAADPSPGGRRTATRHGFRAEFRAGLRFFAGNRVVLAVSSGVNIAMLGMGAVNVLLVFFVTGNLHTSAGWLGVLAAAIAAGSVAGGLASGWVAGRIGPGRVFGLGLIGCGLALAVFSRLTAFGPALAFGALAGLMVGGATASVGPLVLAQVPQELIGRVMAVFTPLQQLAGIASMAGAGFLASTALRGMHVVIAGSTFRAADTIFGAGAVLIAAAGCAVIRLLGREGRSAGPG